MIILVKGKAVFKDCDQRATVEKVLNANINGVDIAHIYVQLLGTGQKFMVVTQDIIGVEIDETLITRFGHFDYKPKGKVVRKITQGTVVQTFIDGKCVRQQFVEDEDVDPHFIDDGHSKIVSKDLLELYHHSNMVQP